MQHPIGEHALLADSRTAALIDPDGNVAWLCWPRIDSTPLLFSILDEDRGGGFSLRPAQRDARLVSRRYHPRSLVLETTWEVEGARLIVDDALDMGAQPLLVRRCRALGAAHDVTVELRTPHWENERAALAVTGDLLEVSGANRVAIRAPAMWIAVADRATCTFRLEPGEEAMVSLNSPGDQAPSRSVETTLAHWQSMVPAPGALDISPAASDMDATETRELLTLSAAVLLGLAQRGGGIVAAPTTSLPQWPASSRTWDYRYCWLRDASLAGTAMLRLGLVDAARGLGAFIGNVVKERGPVPLLRIDGSAPPQEVEHHELAGYGGARPVRIGNAAAQQAQLDVPGEVIELATALVAIDALPNELAGAVPVLATWLTQHWREPDNGIWEIRGAQRRYTHSLVTALSGLNAASALAGAGVMAGDAMTWQQTASAISSELAGTGPFQLLLDGGGADAALAQLALLPGLESLRPRVNATLDLIIERLVSGGLIDRHEQAADTLDDPCAPFVFPTFWLSAALTATGRDGAPWFESALATHGPLGLFGEVADPHDRSPLGNYPQVQSHAAFVLAATSIKPRQ
jgi:GH15 family glucan-1,4-alpha-glucosidase